MPHHIEAVKRCFTGDQFAATSGVELVEIRPGFAKARLAVQPRHLNSVGIVQGGAIFTLADFAFAVACNSSGRVAVAVNMNLSCMKAVRSGTLRGRGTRGVAEQADLYLHGRASPMRRKNSSHYFRGRRTLKTSPFLRKPNRVPDAARRRFEAAISLEAHDEFGRTRGFAIQVRPELLAGHSIGVRGTVCT